MFSSTSPSLPRSAGRGAVVVGCALALLTPALPALASASPAISSLSPAVTHAGRTVTVRGSGLEDASGVSVGGTPATNLVAAGDGLSLSFTVPGGVTGNEPVTVTTTSGGSVTSTGTLEVDAPPAAVTGLTRSLGVRGLVLRWSGKGTGSTVVRALAGTTAPASPTAGSPVRLTSTGSAYDAAFTNTSSRSYSVYTTAADGTSGPATTLTSGPLAVLASTLTLAATPTTIRSAQLSTLTGRLTRTTGGLPLSGAKVAILRRVLGSSTSVLVRTLTTAADGTVRGTVTAPRSSAYTLRFAGDAFSAASTSASRVVRVQPRLTATLSDPSIVLRQSSTLRGAVTPVYAGAAVVVQRYVSGGWRDVRSLRTTTSGTWSTTVAPSVGSYLYRAVLPATTTHLGALSGAQRLQVAPRVLVAGNSGSDVLAVERALARLHYFTGAQDGVFDRNLTHAVIAFEKVERLPRNGTWATAERSRVLAPRGFTLRYPGSGRAVEVDITRQVLVLSQGGAIVRIVDVSTGSERHYTQDGVDNIAHTPRGRYQITHKIDGIRVSKLGELYRPSYFFQGYAVHGNGSVPTYNASHGCVRVTNAVADYLFPLLTVGTPLAVYDE